jgi:hypothetical protein
VHALAKTHTYIGSRRKRLACGALNAVAASPATIPSATCSHLGSRRWFCCVTGAVNANSDRTAAAHRF